MSTYENTDTRTAEQIRADIDRTRDELSGEAGALTEKVDPRTRARQAVTTAKTRTTDAARKAGQQAGDRRVQAVAGVLVAAAAAILVRRRRRASQAQAARRWPAFLRR